jgi:hypothetical protein
MLDALAAPIPGIADRTTPAATEPNTFFMHFLSGCSIPAASFGVMNDYSRL